MERKLFFITRHDERNRNMLRGLTTVTFHADDLGAAQRWYDEMLGIEPYFRKEFAGQLAYLEYRIGDYQHELGFLDRRYAAEGWGDTPGGGVAYWAVDDVHAAFARLVELGATPHQQPTEQGPGFITATVLDPFGNLLGVMYNEHYLTTLESLKGDR